MTGLREFCALLLAGGIGAGSVVTVQQAKIAANPKPAVHKVNGVKAARRPEPAPPAPQPILDCPVAGSPFSADPNLHMPEFNLPALPPAGIAPGIHLPGAGGGGIPHLPPPTIPGVPEPSGWLLLVAGFGTIGLAVRRR